MQREACKIENTTGPKGQGVFSMRSTTKCCANFGNFDVQYSLQEIRPISTPRLHTLLYFHLVPINQIISLGT